MKRVIQEKIFKIDIDDIILLYSYYKQIPDVILTEGFTQELLHYFTIYEVLGEFMYQEVSSKILQSSDCRAAHKNQPITIQCVISNEISNYFPRANELKLTIPINDLIQISTILIDNNIQLNKPFDQREFLTLVEDKVGWKETLDSIFTKDFMYIIEHELTHWLDDALHNRYLFSQTEITRAMELDEFYAYIKRRYDVDSPAFTHYEINAQIQMIARLHQQSRDWNILTIMDIIQLTPGLRKVHRQVASTRSVEDVKKWLLALMKRLHREGLLGKKMNYIPEANRSRNFTFHSFDYSIRLPEKTAKKRLLSLPKSTNTIGEYL